MDPRRLPGTETSLAPLGLALPRGVADSAVESRLPGAFAPVIPGVSGHLLVDLGEGASAQLREPLWSSPLEGAGNAPVLLTHETGPRPGLARGTQGALRLRAYPWKVVARARAPPPASVATLWGVELGDQELSADVIDEVVARRPGFALLPLHLLNAKPGHAAVARLTSGGVPVVGTDPFAGGRLDGSFLGQSPLERGPRGRPLDAEETGKRFAPVLALGFLTAPAGRTLPQAALEFAASLPGVVATLAPFRTPLDLRRSWEAWGRHPLTDVERARLSENRDSAGGSNTPAS